jgi:hypothetical protein
MRRLIIFGLLPAFLLLAAACSGSNDDGDDSGGGTEAPPANTATEAPAATEEPMDEPSAIAAVDGVTCSGDWTNLTCGSTGSFEAVFAVNSAGDGGTATITLGGNVFGAAGGTVELPFALDGDNVVVDAAADFLGTANLTFSTDGAAVDAVFEAPPAFFNDASTATLEDFAFDGSSLSTFVQIDFGDGREARSEITSSCS